MFKLVLLVVVLLCLNNVIAFKSSRMISKRLVSKISMSEPSASDEEGKPDLFSMNRRVRLGRSKDEDGKSNIWSIEPTMQVAEDEDDQTPLQKNIFIGASVIVAAIVALPLFNAFSSLLPDPSDF